LPKSVPVAVPMIKAVRPRSTIEINSGVKNLSALALAPTVTVRKIVMILMRAF